MMTPEAAAPRVHVQNGGFPPLRRSIRFLIFLVPTYFILKLHRSIFRDDFSSLYDHYDFFPQLITLPDAGNGELFASPTTRHLASKTTYSEYEVRQKQLRKTKKNDDGTGKTTKGRARVSLSTRRNATALMEEQRQRKLDRLQKRLEERRKEKRNNPQEDNEEDNEEDFRQKEEEDSEDKRQRERQLRQRQNRRRQRQRLAQTPRRGTQRDAYDDDWVQHTENITSFSYIPVGKYVNSTNHFQHVAAVDGLDINNKRTNTSSPYAYAFVMGGVNEQDGRYLGMLYNILIASYILEKEGSTADVVVYVQMSANSTLTELPANNTRLLEQVGVKIKYLPKPQVENFHQIIMQKMVVLELIEYRRVIFLDTDVMPYCNLDYVFHLSDGPNPILKKNLIIALSGSPANAGFFMLSPKPGEIEKLREIVVKQQEKAKDLPYPHFDENRGWGHVIRPPDAWWTINKQHLRRRWKFVGSHADQGLLYHWVKYYKRSVSIVSGVEVDNYGPDRSPARIKVDKTLENPFAQYTCLPPKFEETFGELPTADARGMAPYRDFVHFLGSNKPWKKRPPPPVATNLESDTPEQYWFFMLRLLNKELNIGLDFENWERIKRTPLGSHPKKDLMVALMNSNQTVV